jgi:hypothetical protein
LPAGRGGQPVRIRLKVLVVARASNYWRLLLANCEHVREKALRYGVTRKSDSRVSPAT